LGDGPSHELFPTTGLAAQQNRDRQCRDLLNGLPHGEDALARTQQAELRQPRRGWPGALAAQQEGHAS
jgi:hypothetical protein